MQSGQPYRPGDDQQVWNLIKDAHSALLVTMRDDNRFASRPMGCLQSEFDSTLWFLTFRDSQMVQEISRDDRVLVSYANPSKYEYVSIAGKARVVEDRHRIEALWFEGLRVWFPAGPDDPDIALLAVDPETAKYWTNAASPITYAWAYLKARLTGQSPSPEQISDIKSVRF